MFLNFSQRNSKSLTTSANISQISNPLQRRGMRMKEIESQTNYKFENKRCAYMSSPCLSGYGGNQLVNCLILFVIFLMVVYVIVGQSGLRSVCQRESVFVIILGFFLSGFSFFFFLGLYFCPFQVKILVPFLHSVHQL